MLEAARFLLADGPSLTPASCPALFGVIARYKIPTTVHRAHPELKEARGNYGPRAALAAYLRRLEGLDREELWELSHDFGHTPLRLFPLYRGELLMHSLSTSSHWHDTPVAHSDRAIFDRAHDRERVLLLQNAAAAMFWVDAYDIFLRAARGTFSHAFMFDGSATHARVLMELCRLSETRCMVLGETIDETRLFIEERYSPIASSPELQLQTVRLARKRALPAGHGRTAGPDLQHLLYGHEPTQQEREEGAPLGAPLLLAMVPADNALKVIEHTRCPLSSSAFWRELLPALLAGTEYQVALVLEAQAEDGAHTRSRLDALVAALPDEQRARVRIFAPDRLEQLARRADRLLGLQSERCLVLALRHGLLPASFGWPTYAGAGFSDDYDDARQLIDDVRQHGHRRTLSLEQYDALLAFLELFHAHCVDGTRAGVDRLAERLAQDMPRPPPLRPSSGRPMEQLRAKTRKLLRDPRRFMQESALLRKLRK